MSNELNCSVAVIVSHYPYSDVLQRAWVTTFYSDTSLSLNDKIKKEQQIYQMLIVLLLHLLKKNCTGLVHYTTIIR